MCNDSYNVFLIMPFDESFNETYEWVRRAVERAGAGPAGRLDADTPAGSLVERLEQALRRCKMCIADVTGNNPNVMWEAGYAMALKKPVLFLTHGQPEENAFDIRGHQTLRYDTLDVPFQDRVKAAVEKTLKRLPTWTEISPDIWYANAFSFSSGSPVYFLDMDYLPERNGGPDDITYTMRDLNPATALIFDVKKDECVGRPLEVFLEKTRTSFANESDIKQNFDDQKRQIIACCRQREYSRITPYHIEPIILETGNRFGRLELLKIGVAIRDAAVAVENEREAPIRGWAVTFNVIKGEPWAIERYYNQIQGYLRGYWF